MLELIDYSKREVYAGSERTMDQVGLTHLSFSVSDLPGALAKVDELGGVVVEGTVTAQMAMIRDPDGQLLEVLSDEWLKVLPPPPVVPPKSWRAPYAASGSVLDSLIS